MAKKRLIDFLLETLGNARVTLLSLYIALNILIGIAIKFKMATDYKPIVNKVFIIKEHHSVLKKHREVK